MNRRCFFLFFESFLADRRAERSSLSSRLTLAVAAAAVPRDLAPRRVASRRRTTVDGAFVIGLLPPFFSAAFSSASLFNARAALRRRVRKRIIVVFLPGPCSRSFRCRALSSPSLAPRTAHHSSGSGRTADGQLPNRIRAVGRDRRAPQIVNAAPAASSWRRIRRAAPRLVPPGRAAPPPRRSSPPADSTIEDEDANTAMTVDARCESRATVQQMKRWLRCLDDWYVSAGHWTLVCVVFLSPVAFILAVWLVPSLRIPALLYVAWLYCDRHTPHLGGRRCELMRNLRFWRYRREYFPIQLVKSVPLPPDRTYLFAAFPHGLIVLGASANMCSDTNRFSRLFPGLVPHVATLNLNFWWPISRELLMAFGCCGASRESILHVLNGAAGNVCVLLVGGVAEAMRALPGQNVIILRNRKGFVRTALQAGSALVPVFSFGESNAFEQVRANWYVRLQRAIRVWTGAPFVIFRGRTMFAGLPIGGLFSVLPYRRPITTVVGRPIQLPRVENPSDKLVDRYHRRFVHELRALFDQHKAHYDDEHGHAATLVIE